MSDAEIIDKPRGIGAVTKQQHADRNITNTKVGAHISKEKRILIKAYIQQGYSYAQIIKELNTCHQTISNIKKEMAAGIHKNQELVDAVKSGNADYLLGKAMEGLEAVDDEKLDKASLRDIAIYSGTMIDKFRLLSNQSTQNVATLHTFFRKSESADTSLSG